MRKKRVSTGVEMVGYFAYVNVPRIQRITHFFRVKCSRASVFITQVLWSDLELFQCRWIPPYHPRFKQWKVDTIPICSNWDYNSILLKIKYGSNPTNYFKHESMREGLASWKDSKLRMLNKYIFLYQKV